ncbi:hypothetical protein D0868_09541 [Hortaea werneckii]|uniref:Uncharacterized protein n=1 Tax=Hortaea werneckii TaxID=91943 RepID=A0A3M6Y8T1_HORWE|nr:hypothetical protein D0868_09541 [Hortaea werneckii]
MIRNSNQNMLLAASNSSSTTAVPSSSTSTRTTQTSSTPSQCWNPTPTCSAGLSNIANNPSDLGGRYYDPAYSALWNVQCAQGSSNTAYFGSWTTNGQGIYACWKGCEKRIGCTAISFDSTGYQQTSMVALIPCCPTIGGGRCYGYSDIGNYTASTLYYASANIIVPNTYFPCPTYNGATYTNPQDGSVWQIRCGVSLDPGTPYASSPEGMIVDMPSCLTACNGVAQCTAAWWQYNSNTEYKDVDPQARGNCYYRTGTVTYNANPSAAAAVRISSAIAGWVAPSSSTARPTCTAYSSTFFVQYNVQYNPHLGQFDSQQFDNKQLDNKQFDDQLYFKLNLKLNLQFCLEFQLFVELYIKLYVKLRDPFCSFAVSIYDCNFKQ